ncbi:MAG: 50S ribosomal protein L4 [Sandaracinaceae bacterium]|nr:50S ribosomal protein L4 [Sandaracinaceae bacterium]
MAKVPVYNLKRESVGELELSDDVFSGEVNEGLFYEIVKAQLASRRAGTSKVKHRAEVAISGKKLYRQKGTGRGRHGDAAAPSFRGGARAHGPVPRDYSYRPPRKMRQGALKSALSMKLKEGRLLIVDSFELSEIKTKNLASVLDALKVSKSSLIVDVLGNEKLRMSARNLDSHQFLPPEGVNVYDLLRHEHLVLTKNAVAALEARCTR